MSSRKHVNITISLSIMALFFMVFQNFGKSPEINQNEGTAPYNFVKNPGSITGKISEIPKIGEDIIIQSGQDIVLDASINVRHLKIDGILRCGLDNDNEVTILAENISVTGKFICGTRKHSFPGKLSIRLKEGFDFSHMGKSMGKRSLVALHGGEIRFYGQRKAAKTKLRRSAIAGSNVLSLAKKVNWKVGDRVLVTSSGFSMEETEVRYISSISHEKKTLTLNEPLMYPHFGRKMSYTKEDGSRVILDERSYVENLTRNITIGPQDGTVKSKKGAHVMIMKSAKAFFNSVQIYQAGRMGELARYPIHWHQVGDATGQFIKNSVIVNSFQRCIVLHETNNVEIKNNTCYNHFSHGIFLESGNEINNIIENNLVVLSKRPPYEKALLRSDTIKHRGILRRFPSPSSYWISNPKNIVRNNVAAGSEGTGFWMAFENNEICDENNSNCMIPAKMDTLEFHNNTAHSSLVGITWDGAPRGAKAELAHGEKDDREIKSSHYSPENKQVFKNLTAYKNRHVGIYFRGDAAVFEDSIVADNNWSLFWAFSQQFKNSSIVGMSPNFREDEIKYLNTKDRAAGIVLYDGPFELNNVSFFDFPDTHIIFNGKNVTPSPFALIGGFNKFENKVKGLYFDPEPIRRVNFDVPESMWNGVAFSNSLRDLDGSLHGDQSKRGFLVVPKHDFNYDESLCHFEEDWNAYSCDYSIGTFVMVGMRGQKHNRIEFEAFRKVNNKVIGTGQVFSSSNGKTNISTAGNKFNMILDSGSYKVHVYETKRLKKFRFYFQAETRVDGSGNGIPVISPVIHISAKGLDGSQPKIDMRTCFVKKGIKLNSHRELLDSDPLDLVHGDRLPILYYPSSNGLYIKTAAYEPFEWHKKSDMSNSFYGDYLASCKEFL